VKPESYTDAERVNPAGIVGKMAARRSRNSRAESLRAERPFSDGVLEAFQELGGEGGRLKFIDTGVPGSVS
jgi:hypothetical protein